MPADPFATTAALGYKGISAWGEGLQTVAEAFGQRKQKEREREQSLDFLKQFGLITEEEPTFEDYQEIIKKRGGTLDLPGVPEGQKVTAAQRLLTASGIPLPKPKLTLDEEKAKVAISGLFPGVTITAKERKKGGYDKPEDVPQRLGGQPLKSLKQDETTGKWFPTYGPPTSFLQMMPGMFPGLDTGGQKDQYGYTAGETKKVEGKTYIYLGNNQWQEK